MMKCPSYLLCVAAVIASGSVIGAAAAAETFTPSRAGSSGFILAQATPAQAPLVRPPTAAKSAPPAKNCRREAVWGFRRSVFCKPTGMCSDREIKGYRTVCA